jgi:prophage maintenance system killer protein
MRIFLLEQGLDINANQEEKYRFVISIASGENKLDEIIAWLNNHVIKNSP